MDMDVFSENFSYTSRWLFYLCVYLIATSPKTIDPLHDKVTWYEINYAGIQVTQWDFQPKKLLPVQPTFLCFGASRVVKFSLFPALGSWGRARKKRASERINKRRLRLLTLVFIQWLFSLARTRKIPLSVHVVKLEMASTLPNINIDNFHATLVKSHHNSAKFQRMWEAAQNKTVSNVGNVLQVSTRALQGPLQV